MLSITKKSFVAIFCSAISLALSADPLIENIEYPKKVKAGEEALIKVIPGKSASDIICRFNGENNMIPAYSHFYSGKKLMSTGTSQATANGNFASGKNNYSTFCTLPFPQDGKKYYIWCKYQNGPLCLKGEKGSKLHELRWNWKSTPTPEWFCFGAFSAAEVGKSFAFMTGNKEPFAEIEAVFLTAVPPDTFKPTQDYKGPGIFTWTPNESATGIQGFTVTASDKEGKDERNIRITVIPATPGTEKDHRIEKIDAKFLPLGNAAASMTEYPLVNIEKASLEKTKAATIFNLPDCGKYIALKCNQYPALPDNVEIDVKGKFNGLLFLLAEYWQGELGQEMASITVEYSDGESIKIPIREEYEISGSLRSKAINNAAWLGELWNGHTEMQISSFAWANPNPEKEIRNLIFSNKRMVFSEEENKMIPLNVTAISSQILIALAGLDQEFLAQALALQKKKQDRAPRSACATVNFQKADGKISPLLFGTNETDILSSGSAGDFDEYLNVIGEVNCPIFRIHSGWNLEKIYPDKLNSPDYSKLVNSLAKIRKKLPSSEIMICINSIPKYIDPKTEEGRELFAELVADLVRKLNIEEKLNVRYWEIYNEVYFQSIDSDRALWTMYNLAAKKMKAIDPSIKTGGYAPCWPSVSKIKDFYQHCNQYVDFISWHKYLTGSVKTPMEYIMKNTGSFGTDTAAIRKALNEVTPGKTPELALTEFNINWNWKPHDPRQIAPEGTAWFASVLLHCIKNGLDIANNWHSRKGGTFGMLGDSNEIRPVARLYYIFNKYLKGKYFPSVTNNENVECLGFADKDAFGFFIVNKSDKNINVNIALLNRPETTSKPFSGNTESFSLSRDGYEIQKNDILSGNDINIMLRPYEVKLFSSRK